MSISVKNLTKQYGEQRAVDNISFEVGQGEILGFLGPNGAGKSTTMKIATCYVAPTAGDVWVNGFHVTEQPIEVKRSLGYLPEHNPLYLEMYVREYLGFVGKLYGLSGKQLQSRIGEMVELCGLAREQHKQIQALSKGYRQRVGLAQALIHDPKVLILDEPTTGLDPNQIVEIRKVISHVASDKTVLFSSHIMQEVQALCDRVVVINQGQIVANDRIDQLKEEVRETVVITVEFDKEINLELLELLQGVQKVNYAGEGRYILEAIKDSNVRPLIFTMAGDNNLTLIGMRQEEESMETIFQRLTQNKG